MFPSRATPIRPALPEREHPFGKPIKSLYQRYLQASPRVDILADVDFWVFWERWIEAGACEDREALREVLRKMYSPDIDRYARYSCVAAKAIKAA